ncbi:hypothetical protein RIF25_04885 [Thermosynechococcaceae cyanobacterium BACA0444]|uniref:Uncharacterized protein n=1 Tax=Pseudocalidococcus azoricus BACA0444 TaxID=2918990 RepID=A0AAE4FSI0_9CYAN|nr:hypothetical protein [Pseudocalidococcus azoricus]MDS3860136.1 hypothetical protein [Pseudocalidococcus azoricus BACA0444]
MLREELKKELDKLNDEQLKQIADFIALVEQQPQQITRSQPFWQTAIPLDRATEFQRWVSQLPKSNSSLNDSAFNRDSIYE